jgi:hypothetical protein
MTGTARQRLVAIRHDLLIAALLMTAMVVSSLARSSMLPDAIYQYRSGPLRTSDLWFDADIPRTVCMATDPLAPQHASTSGHPLLSSLLYFPTQSVMRVTGVGAIDAVRWITALQAGVWILMLYAVLRAIGLRRLDASVFTVLAASTAAAVFWTAVPEAFVLGAASLLLPALVIGRWRRPADWHLAIAAAVSLSVTVTNWSSGWLAAFLARRPRAALQVCVNALVMVALLGAAQALRFPHAEVFPGSGHAFDYAERLHWPDVTEVISVFAVHSIVMPEAIAERQQDPPSAVLTIQRQRPGSGGLMPSVGLVLWLGLLVLGTLGARQFLVPAMRWWLGGMIASQLMLHLMFGDETFLYSMHFAPLLVIVAACSALGAGRRLALPLAIAAIVVLGAHNVRQFDAAAAKAWDIRTEAAQQGARFGPPFDCF